MIATSALGGDWPDALELTVATLAAFDEAASRGDQGLLGRAVSLFALRALDAMGLGPDSGECRSCAGVMGDDAIHSYSRRSGGFVCARCAGREPDAITLPQGAVADRKSVV